MSATKKYLLLLVIFIVASLSTFWFDWYYRLLIIKCFVYFTDEKIQFVGKNFFLFSSGYFTLSFGIYCTLISFRLLKNNITKGLLKVSATISSFFLATLVIAYLKSNAICNNQIVTLDYGRVPYETIFIESLILSLLVFLILEVFVKNNRLDK